MQTLRLLGPETSDRKAHQKWLHQCRDVLRQACLPSVITHRHEYGDLRKHTLDMEGSLRLYRKTPSGKFRAGLELALSGGMHTQERMQRTKGPLHVNCPLAALSQIPISIGSGNAPSGPTLGESYPGLTNSYL